MKSKLFTKKILIPIILVFAILLGASYVSNITVVASRLEKMAYQKEYDPKISPDGLYLIGYEPDENGNKIGTIAIFIGGTYHLNVSNIPGSCNGVDIYRITEDAYNGCTGLEKVILPQTVKIIDKTAFANCSDLKEIYIPSSVTEISDSAFDDTDDFIMYVEKDSYAERFAEEKNITFDYYLPDPIAEQKDSDYPQMKYEEKYEDFVYSVYYDNGGPHGVISYCNSMCSETDLTVPRQIDGVDVKNIANKAFARCSVLESITLPDTVTGIGEYAFTDCGGLKKVYFTENVSAIGKDIFLNIDHPVTICAPENSYAHKYAIENNINFESTD